MSAATRQEAELSKQAITYSSEIVRLRAVNKELLDINASYERIANDASHVESRYHTSLGLLHKANAGLDRFHKIIGRIYWYK